MNNRPLPYPSPTPRLGQHLPDQNHLYPLKIDSEIKAIFQLISGAFWCQNASQNQPFLQILCDVFQCFSFTCFFKPFTTVLLDIPHRIRASRLHAVRILKISPFSTNIENETEKVTKMTPEMIQKCSRKASEKQARKQTKQGP